MPRVVFVECFGEEREVVVSTPPGYAADGDRRYPVLVLLHGVPSDAHMWSTVGATFAGAFVMFGLQWEMQVGRRELARIVQKEDQARAS